jgi:hypothetical protein
MRGIVLKLHIYAGLLTFAHLMIYGIAGLTATFQAAPVRPKIAQSIRYVPFTPAPNSTDKEVAGKVYELLRLPLTRPMPDFALQRTPDKHLLLDFYNINGIYRVVVLESENRLRIENMRKSAWLFFADIHAATPGDAQAPPLVRAWGWWNEAAMWSLLGFCVSGVYLWLTSQPRLVWAWAAAAFGSAVLALLWGAFRR